MWRKIPITLIYLRLVLGLVVLLLSMWVVSGYKWFALSLLTIGLLTDVFDGIVARRLHISTQRLRRLDSTVDQIFFITIALATYLQCPDFFYTNKLQLFVLLAAEGLAYGVCFWRFKKEVATHSIGAKIWTLFLFATLVEVILRCQSTFLFQCCFWIGILSRAEIIAILCVLKTWANDVPTLFHALKLRQGKAIKRHKWFNG